MNFELGDRVKCVGDVFNKGAIGIVSKVAVDYIEVKFNDREIYGYPYSYLEKIYLEKIYLERKEGDLISRQAVENITWEEPSYTDPLNVLTEVREKVRALPSVENKGEWIKGDVTRWKCSICHYGVLDWNNTPFCPNCGADMRGE